MTMELYKNISDFITLIAIALPVIVQLFRLIGAKTSNQKMTNLANRAQIIVSSLQQLGFTNDVKKTMALEKLTSYAKEVKIHLTAEQAEDYIEDAVRVLKILQSIDFNKPKESDVHNIFRDGDFGDRKETEN